MWFEAPAWSSAPHFDGHHFPVSLSFGGVAALAVAMGESENLPCSAPARAPAPANPAALRNPRRSVGADALPLESESCFLVSVMLPSQVIARQQHGDFNANHD